jgi:hypothetical protein
MVEAAKKYILPPALWFNAPVARADAGGWTAKFDSANLWMLNN